MVDQRKRVVYVSNSAQLGGMEKHLLDLISGLSGRYKVYVVCPDGPMVSEYKEAGAEVIIDKPSFDIDPTYIFRLVNRLKKINPLILHAHQLKTGVNALIAGFLAKVPMRVSHVHTPLSMWKISNLKKSINIWVYRTAVNLLSSFEIALTESIKKRKIREGIRREKLLVIPNGIDYKRFRNSPSRKHARKAYGIKENTFLIGAIGIRLSLEKDHKNLLKALYELDRKLRNWHLIIGGTGPLEEELKGTVKKLQLERKVNFIGRFVEAEKPSLLSSLDVFIFPTMAEGFGIVLLEAMAAGVPCLAADLPVLQEVGGDSVAFYKTSNYKSLAKGILRLYSDPGLRKRLADSGRVRVKEHFTLENFWMKYEDLYKKAVG